MQYNISQAINYACVLPAILWFSTVLLQLKSTFLDSNLVSAAVGATYSEVPYFTYTYLPTPWRRVLLENLTAFQLVKKFSAFYGTRWFITAFTSARHLSLS